MIYDEFVKAKLTTLEYERLMNMLRGLIILDQNLCDSLPQGKTKVTLT